ncbi:hypothetical protein ACKKBG_A20980 [Auxenochlorella protothecoides x Auxenochlorella symbiontica]|uniref:Uncharacterized protein n=1 Tax=Auxenochlorella protothecoides TaxID=3075 RepID=A0A3M7L3W3_AUXPR|nr:hypothetical protein APUTEX25_002998 [Auxenochlorella protothecoides]|eukprot:RMZ56909.1 hypothetical protein APUTEX25_002998 [Auxenochlorella protothecoides]
MGAGAIFASILDQRKKMFNRFVKNDKDRADVYRKSMERRPGPSVKDTHEKKEDARDFPKLVTHPHHRDSHHK